ncbi:hypothetical protein SAMN04487972_10155 [Paracoccus halophilus]|uniref:Gamma-glutamyl kinase n=1 Tax=Paracoccus halophilus TaxID=376733 RepID=A0A099F8E7_9RHOB|nr:sulfotransferase family 2 domain-containing protein [Paracoccus halophilus]KGJ06496.1 gamma-glutamyl kinase [Paracoccus halophilus]SFA37967.1 hypothetical protein SAMN04487972_10155 [Paracoccus halophilus]
MLIFLGPRIVLLSVPKTGTTALEEALAPLAEIAFRAEPSVKHLNLRQYRNRIQPLIARRDRPAFQTVAVVREPLDWLGSWYRYRRRDALIGHRNSTAGIDFEQFVTAYLQPDGPPPYARLGRQSELLIDHDGRVAVDHIFRYEAMPLLVDFLSERLNHPITLERVNVSPAAALELTPATRERLRRELAGDYAIWQAARHAGE